MRPLRTLIAHVGLGPLLLGAAAALLLAACFPPGVGSGDGDSDYGGKPVDPWAPLEPATAIDATVKPGTRAFRAWVLARFPDVEVPGSPENILGDAAHATHPSEHNEGRAWDLMTVSAEAGQRVVDALLAADGGGQPAALARRAGIMYLIWQRRMWRAYPYAGAPSGSWSDYHGADPHTGHVHFSLSRAGAAGRTSLYVDLGAA